ncbi:MAG: thioredoxin domain-containing protein, partial [Dehalococcoidia bacterium]
TKETLDYVLREMTDPKGGFYSAQDADTEGEEGRYYIWTAQEIIDVLGQEEGALIGRYFGTSEQGNFEGGNVLHMPTSIDTFAVQSGVKAEDLLAIVERSKNKLLKAREQRVRPGRDDKILTSWNGMMLQSFSEAACILEREDYRLAAIASATFLLDELRDGDLLMHSYMGGKASIPGYLDDYSLLIGGLLAVHQASFDQRWLEEAISLADTMIQRFWDREAEGLFYDTADDHSTLFLRPRDIIDSVKPCGGSAAADVLLRLSIITGDTTYESRAVAALSSLHEQMTAHPLAFGNWLCALDFNLASPKEIAVAGVYDKPETQALLRIIHGRYMPNKVLVGVEPSEPYTPKAAPLLENRTMRDGRPTVYLCHKYACQAPTTDPEALQEQLGN